MTSTETQKTSAQNATLKQNVEKQQIKAMKRLPEKVGILFKWRFGRYDLGAWKKFFASVFHALFWETVLEHMSELNVYDAEAREEELIERQKAMHGVHLSDNESFCFVYHTPCPQCKEAIEIRNQAQIPDCPHCNRKINLQPLRLNTLSSREFVLFLQSQKFQWEPDGFHWYQDEQKQQLVITCAMAKHTSYVEADFPSEEVEGLIETLIGLPSYVHFHGNMVPDEEGEMSNGWSANLILRPPKQEGFEWKFKPVFGDILDFLQLPSWLNRQDFVQKLCNNPRCKHLNPSWYTQCGKCSNTLLQGVKRFKHNDWESNFPRFDGKRLYRCGNCKAPVTDRNLETGQRITKCWSCHQPLGRWNADKRFDADFDQWKHCGFCGYQFNGSPSHCPCCSTFVKEQKPVTCGNEECGKVFNKALFNACPSCGTATKEAIAFTTLRARKCAKEYGGCGQYHDKRHIEYDGKKIISCPTTREGIPRLEVVDFSELRSLFEPTSTKPLAEAEEVIDFNELKFGVRPEEETHFEAEEVAHSRVLCPVGCGEKLLLEDQTCSGCKTEIHLCECRNALIAPNTNQCPGCGKEFNYALDGWEEIPAEFFHLNYSENPEHGDMFASADEWESEQHIHPENDLITAPVWDSEEEYSEESGLTWCEWRALEEHRQEERDLDRLHSSEWQLSEKIEASPFSEKHLAAPPISDFSLGNSQNLWEEAFLEAVDTVAVMLEQHFVETIVENEELEAWKAYTPSTPEVVTIPRARAAKDLS